MKKLFFIAVAAFCCVQGLHAQKVKRFGVFDHVALGISAGTPGAGAELAAPITDFIAMRAGYTFMPDIKYKHDVNYKAHGIPQKTEVEAKLKWGNAHLLFDLYPFKGNTFHATFGAYYGDDMIIKAENKQPIVGLDPGEGLEIGDYIVGPDENGIAHAGFKVKKLKPFVGLGFGRAVPRHRVGLSANFGLQFWDTPNVCAIQDGKEIELTSADTGHKDEEVIDKLSEITFWPVIDLRLVIRLF